MLFPQVDPIPLPAPVWLMKALSLLTLALHFSAVFLLLGGLTLAIWLNLRGTRPENQAARDASYALARRLPVVMTYVINLGIPPLLFAQVLYGRSLYTSTVLIGAMWIAVIPLLMLAYWLLYQMSDRIAAGKSGAWHGLASLLIAIGIAQIFSFNMTLMLRPEVWQGMYSQSATGLMAPPKDPTVTPRWLFMLCGGLGFGALGALLLAHTRNLSEQARTTLRKSAGALALVALVAWLPLGWWVTAAQPSAVQQALSAHPFYRLTGILFLALAGVTLVLGILQAVRPPQLLLSIGSLVTGFLAICAWVLYRDGIRDITLLASGFNVWDRVVVANWSVIILFLLLFVGGLGVVGWLLSVVAKATPEEERVAA